MSGDLRHEAGLYDGDDGLLSMLVPFARDAAAAGEPTVFVLHERHAALLRPVLEDTPGVTFLPFAYARPAGAVKTLLHLFRTHATGSARRLRVVGEVHEPTAITWEPWARYEAAANALYAEFPVWALCAYDTQTTPESVLTDVLRTHPHIHSDGAHRPNEGYEPPARFLAGRPEPRPDPLERTPAAVALLDPTPAQARRTVAALAQGCTGLQQEELDEFVYGLNEVVTNAHVHGRPPVSLRAWATGDRLHAVVRDAGSGLTDPFAGLRPDPARRGEGGGLGLWMAHQVCGQVTHSHDRDGFTVRLTARA